MQNEIREKEKMKITVAKETLPKSTVKLTITLPWLEVEKIYQETLKKKAEQIEVPGFRKGKAPRSLVKKKISQEALLRETLQEILPQAYANAIREQNIRPIIQPKIKVVAMEEGQDWQFEATTCEKPEIRLGNYQEAVKNGLQSSKIWIPGKEEKKGKESRSEKIKKLLEILLKTIKIELPPLLVEEEVNRLLSSLLEQINKLGLTLDAYLNSTRKTVEQIKKEYQLQAERALKIEVILEAIAADLKVMVEEKEIEEMIEKTTKDKEEKKRLAGQKYYLATILRREKTIDKLLHL